MKITTTAALFALVFVTYATAEAKVDPPAPSGGGAAEAKSSQEAPAKSDKKAKLPKQEVVNNLRNRVRVREMIGELKDWPAQDVLRLKILDHLKAVLEDASALKLDRLAVIGYMSDLAHASGDSTQKELANLLCDGVEKVSSPLLSAAMAELLFSLDQISHAATEKKVTDLLGRLLDDAGQPAKSQKSPALHAVALDAVNAEWADAKAVKTLTTITARAKEIEPDLQIAAFRAVGRLTQGEAQKKGILKKEDKALLAKNLLDAVENNPAHVPAENTPAGEGERRMLAAALGPLGVLLADAEVKDDLRARGLELLGRVLGHPDASVMEMAGGALVDLSRGKYEKKLASDPALLLLDNLKKRVNKANTPEGQAGREAAYAACRLALRHLNLLVASKAKEDQASLAEELQFFRLQFLQSPDLAIKDYARQAFMVLEPGLFEKKILGPEAVAAARAFMGDCIEGDKAKQIPALFEMNAGQNPALKAVQESAAQVLQEMTGHNYGTDTRLWKEWLASAKSKAYAP